MTRLIDDYLREVERSLPVRPSERRRIVEELRSHLLEKVYDLRTGHPGRALEEIEREVLADFGNPRELALAYESEGAVLRDSAGRVVLRVGQAVGRGTRKVLKWTAITVGVLVLVAGAVGAWAYYEAKPFLEEFVEKNSPVQLYHYSQDCPAETCNRSSVAQSFYVDVNARDVRIELGVSGQHTAAASGTVHLEVRDAGGIVKFDRSVQVTNQTRIHETARWSPSVGDWRIVVELDAFRGDVDVTVSATGLEGRSR